MTDVAPRCRSCQQDGLVTVLSLGRTPLANALLSREQLDQPEATYPLDLVYCPSCALVQITETVSPETLFREYLYFSSFSDTMLQHARTLASRLTAERELGAGSLVVEIASNDGYLLQNYRDRGVPILGIEPAVNIARVAEERGIPTLSEFFGEALARQLRAAGRQADVIHAHNVLAHVPDLNGFVAGMALLLKDDGIAVVEVPYVRDLIDHVEFDTIYHEHLCYFSVTSLRALFGRHGLAITTVERVPIHGGSLRVAVARDDCSRPGPDRSASVIEVLEEEAQWGVSQFSRYAHFAAMVEDLCRQLVALLHDLKLNGKQIAAYGAAAKGSTLLNYCGIGRETLDFVADRSTAKQGRYTPGSHLPIVPPEHLLQAMPAYVLLLTWNFAEEILAQQQAYRQRGGKFIIPVPHVRVV